MTFVTRNHKDDITYWSPLAKTGSGARTFNTPVDLKGRWEDEQIMFVASDGRESISKAIVSLGQAVVEGGYLYLGTKASISSAANPKDVSDAYEIRGIGKVGNIKNTTFYREAIL